MTRTVRLALATIVCFGSTAGQACAEENCRSPYLNTYEHAECEERNLAAATVEMDAAFARVLDANRALLAEGWNVDFKSELRATQRAWARWMQKQCELERNVVMGSAGAFAQPICQRLLTVERTRSLDELAHQIDPRK